MVSSASLCRTIASAIRLILFCSTGLAILSGCSSHRKPFETAQIVDPYRNVAPSLVRETRRLPVERGKPRPVIDGIGWVVGIPSKVLLWDRRVNNHRISEETEAVLTTYLTENDLGHVKVRLNQYRPLDDWRRLTKNRSVGWPYRYTVGALTVAVETILPGRIFGHDSYNPYTATLHLYSDVPSLALREGGRAKDVARREYPGSYAFWASLPIIDLWPATIAYGEAIAYAQANGDVTLRKESYNILYPAYGGHLGNSAGTFASGLIAMPIYLGGIIAGHAAGRVESRRITESGAVIAMDASENSVWPADEEAEVVLVDYEDLSGETKAEWAGYEEPVAWQSLPDVLSAESPEPLTLGRPDGSLQPPQQSEDDRESAPIAWRDLVPSPLHDTDGGRVDGACPPMTRRSSSPRCP